MLSVISTQKGFIAIHLRISEVQLPQLLHQRVIGSSCLSELVTVAFLFTFTLSRLNSDLLVVFLQCCQVFAGFGELTFFHTFAHIPVHECTLAVHEIELVVNAREDLCDGCGITDHAHSTHYFGEVASWYHRGWLVIDTALEASGAPIHKLDRSLRLNRCNSSINILRHNVATVHQATGHVFAMTRVALHVHGSRFEDRHGDLCHRKLLMVCLLCRDDWRVA